MAADELSIRSLGAVLAVAHATDRSGKMIGAVRSSLCRGILAFLRYPLKDPDGARITVERR
jgi:hypothetical protein